MPTPAPVPESFILAGNDRSAAQRAASEVEQSRLEEAALNERSLSDYQRNSWRWNDIEALRYDLDAVIGKRDRAQAMANTLWALSGVRAVSGVSQSPRLGLLGAAARGVTRLANPAVGLGAFALGATAAADARRFERQRRALEARILELAAQR